MSRKALSVKNAEGQSVDGRAERTIAIKEKKMLKRLFQRKTKVKIKLSYPAKYDIEKTLSSLNETIKHYPNMAFEIVLHWKQL